MRTLTMSLAVAMVALLLGCDSTESPKPPGERMFDTQQQALERAREVDGMVRQQAEQQRREIDRQSQ